MSKKKAKPADTTIALNKKARHDYQLETRYEAGIALQGWEVKSCRAGKVQLVDSFVQIDDGEAFLFGCLITPLNTVSTHFVADPRRKRKLLLHQSELAKLHQATQAKGYTCVCTAMYWKQHLIKVEIALAKGKQQHDKREAEKERDWNVQKQRVLARNN